MSVHFVRDMERLHRDLLSMCAMVEEFVQRAVALLDSPDVEVAELLLAGDADIDRCDVRLEEECLKILAMHQPVAIDLRRVATVLRVTGELERVADLAVNIAERAIGLASLGAVSVPAKLHEMAQVALAMLRQSIDSFVETDSQSARLVCAQDDEVDQLNREIISELIESMEKSPASVQPSMHLFSAARHVERIADHATNIAEGVVYMVDGEIIRHQAELSRGN